MPISMSFGMQSASIIKQRTEFIVLPEKWIISEQNSPKAESFNLIFIRDSLLKDSALQDSALEDSALRYDPIYISVYCLMFNT